jgi:MYXO-CTERM domain-containing protein
MNSRALRRIRQTVALLLVMFLTVIAIPMALAQAPGTPQGGAPQMGGADTRADISDDDNGNWGLLGLIGLVGLAGLMRRDRTRPVERPVERPAERVGRP